MRTLTICVVAGLTLAGCSGETNADADGDGTVSEEEMAEASKEAIKPQPGKYKTTISLTEVNIPGAPPEIVEMMKGGMANQTSESCMTQEDADKGFEEMAKGTQDGECTTQKFVINGGDIDAEMTCKAGDDSEMRMTIDGTGTTSSMDMVMTMEGEIPQMGEAKMVMNLKSERIGDCDK